ncbi:hypothetical protein SALBM217S_02001 [Streptomyces griseoloalbus]
MLRLVDGNMSTRSDRFGPYGFTSLDEALRWLDDESSFITAALRHAEGVDQGAVLNLLGALCDYCLLRGDLYRLGEINELAQAVDEGLLVRSVQWRTGIAARQLGELDTARTTLTSVVDLYREAQHVAGEARALTSLGITLHHQGNLTEASARLREALELQASDALATDRAWTMHALAAVERDRARLAEALELLTESLVLHRAGESLHGQAWAHFQLGQLHLRRGDVPRAAGELRTALDLYGRTRDARGEAWALTELARARLVDGDAGPAVEQLRSAAARHRDNEDARGEAWTLYYLGQALEESGNLDRAVRELERARTMFSRMRDVYGLACARHHSARVTRDQRAAQTGSLRNSGFARQLLVDARADFQRIGVAHGEAWTCLELAVVDAGNARTQQALALCDEAVALFASYGDRRGEDWARFLRCTLLPYAAPGGTEVGSAVAQQELTDLAAAPHPARDPELTDCVDACRLLLERGVTLEAGWQAWNLGLVPSRHRARGDGGTGPPGRVAPPGRVPAHGRGTRAAPGAARACGHRAVGARHPPGTRRPLRRVPAPRAGHGEAGCEHGGGTPARTRGPQGPRPPAGRGIAAVPAPRSRGGSRCVCRRAGPERRGPQGPAERRCRRGRDTGAAPGVCRRVPWDLGRSGRGLARVRGGRVRVLVVRLREVHAAHVPVHRLDQAPDRQGQRREDDEAEDTGGDLVLVEFLGEGDQVGQCQACACAHVSHCPGCPRRGRPRGGRCPRATSRARTPPSARPPAGGRAAPRTSPRRGRSAWRARSAPCRGSRRSRRTARAW